MAVDWNDEEPLEPPPEPTRVLRTIEEAVALLDEWRVAYHQLWIANERLQHRYADAMFALETARDLARHLEPFLPERLRLKQPAPAPQALEEETA